MNYLPAIRRSVKRLRKEGETMRQIAKRAGVTRTYLYLVLDGTYDPTLPVAERIATAVGVEIKISNQP
jgi:DNA-binding phage protein